MGSIISFLLLCRQQRGNNEHNEHNTKTAKTIPNITPASTAPVQKELISHSFKDFLYNNMYAVTLSGISVQETYQ